MRGADARRPPTQVIQLEPGRHGGDLGLVDHAVSSSRRPALPDQRSTVARVEPPDPDPAAEHRINLNRPLVGAHLDTRTISLHGSDSAIGSAAAILA